MKISKFLVILNISLIYLACTNIELTNQNPTCKITSPLNNSTIGSTKYLEVYLIANDTDGNISNLKLLVDNVVNIDVDIHGQPSTKTYALTLDIEKLIHGNHIILLIATDNDGGIAKDSITIMINGNTNYYCKIISPLSNSSITYYEGFNVDVKANIADGTLNYIKLFVDNVYYSTSTYVPNPIMFPSYIENTFMIYPNILKDGKHTLLAIATYSNGVSARDSININIDMRPIGYRPPTCKIINPLNNSNIGIDECSIVDVMANDTDGYISNVKLFVDNIEYGVIDTLYPYRFIIFDGRLKAGKHTLKAISTDNNGISTKDSIVINQLENKNITINQPENYFLYEGNFTFKIRSVYFLLNTITSDVTTVSSGKIKFTQNGIITLYFSDNDCVSFQFNGGNFISEGDWYNTGGKEGGFFGQDSVSFHLKTPGYRSGKNTYVTGKRN